MVEGPWRVPFQLKKLFKREFPEGMKENKVLPDQASFRQIFDCLQKQTEKNELVTVPGTIQERSSMKTQSIQAKNWNWKKRVECWLLKTEWTQFRRGSPFDSKKTWEKRHNKTKKRKQRNKKALVLVLLISYISLKFTPKSGFHTGTKSESVVDKAQTCWRVNRKPKPHTIKQIMFAFIPSPFMKSQLPRQNQHKEG